MKYFRNQEKNNRLMVIYLVIISVAAWVIAYRERIVLAYNDSMSYMNIARLVIDNQQPGLAQLGTVWPPLNHILKLPLIWNEWAWHSGFAGSLISMVSFVLMSVGIYLLVMELTNNRLASIMASLLAVLNLNVLYLQSTPLTEPLYLALLVYSGYFLIRYLRSSDNKYLIPLAFLAALQIVTRYDGWFVGAVIALIILGFEMFVRKQTVRKSFGQTLLYVTPVAFACLVWLGWNALIFGDPLYFATGPFSAQSQQSVIASETGLVSEGNIFSALRAYATAGVENIGLLVTLLAGLGWLVGIKLSDKRSTGLVITAAAVFGSVFIFNVLALFLGFSVINLPYMANGLADTSSYLFNVRYGILLLPFAAVGAGLLVSRFRFAAPVLLVAMAVQGLIMYRAEPITLRDGRVGASAFVQGSIAQELSQRIEPGDDVLMSMYEFNQVAFESALPLKQFVHEGVSRRWEAALERPQDHAEWVVVAPEGTFDLLREALLEDQEGDFADNYQLVYEDEHAQLYRLRTLSAQR